MKLSKLLETTSQEQSGTTLTSAASTVEQMLISPGAVRLFYHIIGSYFRILEEQGIARGEYSREIYTIQLKGRNDPVAVTRNFYIPYQPENTRIYTAVDTVSEMLEGAMAQIPEQYVPYSWAHLHPGFSPLPSSTDARNNYSVLDRLGSNNKLTGYDRLTIRKPKVVQQGDQLVLFDETSKKRVSLKLAAATEPKQPLAIGEWIDESPVTIYWTKSLIFNGRDLDGFFQSFSVPNGGHDTRFAYSEISLATIHHDGTINRSTYEIPIRVMEVADDIVLTDELKAQIDQTLREKVVVPTQRGYRAIPEYMIDQLSREDRLRMEREEVTAGGQPGTQVAQPEPEVEYAPLSFGESIRYAVASIMGLPEPPRRIMPRRMTMPPPPLKMKVKAFVGGQEVIMEREIERT